MKKIMEKSNNAEDRDKLANILRSLESDLFDPVKVYSSIYKLLSK